MTQQSRMDPATQQQLLALNRRFYATVAIPFDATRQATPPGKVTLVARLLANLPDPAATPLHIADIGCGNGRLAWLLAEQMTAEPETSASPRPVDRPVDAPHVDALRGAGAISIRYVGVDANAALLNAARHHTAGLHQVDARFVQADLAEPEWQRLLPMPDKGFDCVVCLATLHHLPGFALRATVMQRLAQLVRPGGIVAVSTWLFLESPRLAAKIEPWHKAGIDPENTEPGDALLPWRQGTYALRYVHQIDADEVAQLAQAAQLSITEQFRADGKEGNLNLYTLLHPSQTG